VGVGGQCRDLFLATCTSPLEAHAEFLLGLIAEQPDLTLDEVIAAMKKRQPQRGLTIDATSASKKLFTRRSKSAQKLRANADAGCESKVCLTLPAWCSSTRCACAVAACAESD
jgi:hypothetical protein